MSIIQVNFLSDIPVSLHQNILHKSIIIIMYTTNHAHINSLLKCRNTIMQTTLTKMLLYFPVMLTILTDDEYFTTESVLGIQQAVKQSA